jgi:hypothetical protein
MYKIIILEVLWFVLNTAFILREEHKMLLLEGECLEL